VGALNTLIGLALAVASAAAVSRLAHRQLSLGLGVLAVIAFTRWAVSWASDEWSIHAADLVRDHWRGSLLDHFARPLREGQAGRGDLALAIERVSDAPALQVLKTSAQVSALGLAVIFWSVGWLSTLITLALVLLAVPLYRRAGLRSEALTSEYHRRRAQLESRQLELLRHAPELRALGAVTYGADEIEAISRSEHRAAMRAVRVVLESSLITEFLSGVSIGLVAMVVGFGLLDGRLTLFHALVAVLVTSELFGRVRRFGAEFHRREDAAGALEILTVSAVEMPATGPTLLTAYDLVTAASGDVVELHVRARERVLVTGPSGSGKTTLLHTLLGWRSPRSGTVTRSNDRVGFVSVESELLSGSLRENLTLGIDVDPSIVHHQLSVLGLDGPRFADLDNLLLADGRGLSVGERVRLVLARCLLADPSLLLLDDIAGVLDQTSREQVAAALNERPDLAIIEATVDTPLIPSVTRTIEVGR
jgi:ABC-type transport system involved in cytochrome bd biosynthesis fused ATPase/permease subunit